MKHSSNSYKHNPTAAKQPRDFRSRTSTITQQTHDPRSRISVDNHSDQPVLPVCDRSPSLFADFMRLVICALAGVILIVLLVPMAFAADERESATPVEYIPVVSTATEPVLTTTVAEVYAQEASAPVAPYYTTSVNEGKTPDEYSDKTAWIGAAIIVAMLCSMQYNNCLAREIKVQIKELSDKIDTMSRP